MKCSCVTVAALLVLALAAPARAQSDSTAVPTPKAFHVWLGGGISFPASGTFKDTYDNGWNARGLFSYQSAGMPIGIRLDVGYQEFQRKSIDEIEGPGPDASIQALSALGDITYDFHLGSIRPYVAIGAGAYQLKQEVDDDIEGDDDDSDVKFGINGAIGLKLPVGKSLMLFAEGRIDNVFADEALIEQDDLQMIPVTVGIIF